MNELQAMLVSPLVVQNHRCNVKTVTKYNVIPLRFAINNVD